MSRPESMLIIVPGHGVCTAPNDPNKDESWIGIFPGEGQFYAEHAKQGVEEAAKCKQEYRLVFSGGQTREAAGPLSEAKSYFDIASNKVWWGHTDVKHNSLKEEYARDSFENLLFSIALFLRDVGTVPEHVVVIGWKFKEQRFNLHRQAIKWPKNRFTYIGVNNPVGDELTKAQTGEKAKLDAVKKDLFLVGPEWLAQRELRDPFRRRHPYRGINAHLDTFFDFLDCHTYSGDFPW